MAELALDHDKRDAFVCHLNRVRVPELVRSEPATHSSELRGWPKLLASGRGFPVSSRCRAADHA